MTDVALGHCAGVGVRRGSNLFSLRSSIYADGVAPRCCFGVAGILFSGPCDASHSGGVVAGGIFDITRGNQISAGKIVGVRVKEVCVRQGHVGERSGHHFILLLSLNYRQRCRFLVNLVQIVQLCATELSNSAVISRK